MDNASMMEFRAGKKTCRFCLELIELDCFVELQDVEDLIKEYVSEVDVDVINEAVVCQACVESFQSHFKFFTSCLEVEKNVVLYMASSNVKSPLDLFNVLQFSLETKTEEPTSTMAVKSNRKKQYLDEASTPSYIKAEEIVYKNNQSSNITPETTIQGESMGQVTAKYFECDICRHKIKHKGSLTRHQLTHKGPDETEMFKCNSCAFTTKHKQSLNNHMVLHTDLEVFYCDLCPFKTKHKYNIGKHKVIHRSLEEIAFFQCDKCDYKTKRNYDIQRHYKLMHKNPVTYKCDFCAYTTMHKGYIEKHRLKHKNKEDVKKIACDNCTCAKQTSQESPEETEFECDICGYKTNHKCSVANHMVIHKTPKNTKVFECEWCSYKTNRTYNLKKHKLGHKEPR